MVGLKDSLVGLQIWGNFSCDIRVYSGNARVIIPYMTPCVACTVDLYPPRETYPLCTIASTPRLPEHCVEYTRVILWEKEKPFGGIL